MKKISWFLLALPLAFMACNNQGKDSVAKADSSNEAKVDTTNQSRDTAVKYGDTTRKAKIGVDESTASFLVKVADVGKTEVKLGHLTEEKASSRRVKEFGAMMVRDHSKANEELKDLAGRKNVTLPANISEDHQKK